MVSRRSLSRDVARLREAEAQLRGALAIPPNRWPFEQSRESVTERLPLVTSARREAERMLAEVEAGRGEEAELREYLGVAVQVAILPLRYPVPPRRWRPDDADLGRPVLS